jgi:hypothetical protein
MGVMSSPYWKPAAGDWTRGTVMVGVVESYRFHEGEDRRGR